MAAAREPRERRPILAAIGGVAAGAVLVTGAVVAQGYDAREIPRLETTVWVTRDAGQYARVNTDLAEIDTVRRVQNPSNVVQAGPAGLVFGQGDRQYWPIDPAVPADLVAEEVPADAAASAPSRPADPAPTGTREVAATGDHVLFITERGGLEYASVADVAAGTPAFVRIDPFADAEVPEGQARPVYVADAAAVTADGLVAMYSGAESAVRRFDVAAGAFLGDPVAVPGGPEAGEPLEMAFVGETWVLFAPGDGAVWVDGLDAPLALDLGADARLQSSAPEGERAFIASTGGLVAIELDSGEAVTVAEAAGTPARPAWAGGVVAAWLTEDAGTLWTEAGGETIPLEVEAGVLDDVQAVVPVLRSNGDRAVLNETASGMLWTVPEGRLIPTSAWDVEQDDREDEGTVVVDDASEQEPPVAEPDEFGVRAGALVTLPVLYNDHDPNRADVLSIVPESVTALSDPAFGVVGVVGHNQTLTIRVAAVTGSATFSYAVTDGKAVSAPATVTVTVVPDDENSAPVWCGDACLQTWPAPQLAPGGSTTVDVLTGWIDPEGDPFVLQDVLDADPESPVIALPTADGKVAIRHPDPNALGGEVTLTVVLLDSRGAAAQRELVVSVSAAPTLDVRPAVVVGAIGELTSVDVGDFVSGGSGSFRLVDAVDSSGATDVLSVVPNVADGRIELTASAPGEYTVSYAVQDAVTAAERTSTIRFSVGAAAPALAIAPLTAFIRPNEDALVGVLQAVQNTTGRVLIVADARPDTPSLSAAVIAQSHVRVRGATSDGQPGPIGTITVTVTDGAGTTIEGAVTVFLIPAARDTSPIALPDAVTVRAGRQVDIPVLANDVSPRGEQLLVTDVVGSGAPGELAFAADGVLRYLAPSVPGTYVLSYAAVLPAAPERPALATVTVTVVPGGANRPPQPTIVKARAIAGQTVEIDVDTSGMDPDGDAVVLVDVGQPDQGEGAASIAGSGRAIVYHAPPDGVADGQVSFAYTVRDALGQTAEGVVRVGVLPKDVADLAPVTFSDRVRAPLGSAAPLTVRPLLDDRDPGQGVLELVSLVPNAPGGPGNPEYDRLRALIAPGTSLEDGVVSLLPGDVPGTHSYIYTVRSSRTTSTAQGLIVVTVVDGSAPDLPVVADTIVTAANRLALEDGIDVLGGKVRWVAGDPSTLELRVWGDAADRFTANGSRISGPLPEDGAVVPFELSGLAPDGSEVVAYGFLRIPAFDDMRIQLAPDAEPVVADEEQTTPFDVAELLDLDEGDAFEMRDDASYRIQRANSSCRATGPTTATYTAGREAPWSDTCVIPVRLPGQETWSMVAVPISIVPEDPQAILTGVSRTIAPAAVETIDLYGDLTSWEGDRVDDRSRAMLDYRVDFAGTAFIVERVGERLRIQARADAPPGTRESIRVSVSSFGGLSAVIQLTVGVAPVDAPRGATITATCQTSRSSCQIPLVGVGGEYDPFAGQPGGGLTVVGIGTASGGSASCDFANLTLSSASSVTATWPSGSEKPLGGDCVFPFTVRDAQGRTGLGELRIDVQGYSVRPQSITTRSYTGSSVTLLVGLGQPAHPEVTHVRILEGSAVVATCPRPAGASSVECTIGGLENGDPHTYHAIAVNAIGDSNPSSTLTTWAYQAPTATFTSAETVYDAARTAVGKGAVRIELDGSDDVRSYQLTTQGGASVTPAVVTGPDFAGLVQVDAVGPQTIVATPVSRFEPPVSGPSTGAALTQSLTVVGKPSVTRLTASEPAGNAGDPAYTVTLSATIDAGFADAIGRTARVEYFMAEGATAPTCADDGAGGFTPTGQSSPTFEVDPNSEYSFTACVSYGFGFGARSVTSHSTYLAPPAPPAASYTIGTSPGQPAANTYHWQWDGSLALGTPPSGFEAVLFLGDTPVGGPSAFDPAHAGWSYRYCLVDDSSRCGPATAITPTTLPTELRIAFPTACADAPGSQAHADALAARTVFEVGPSTAATVTALWVANADPAAGGHYEFAVHFADAYADAAYPGAAPVYQCAAAPPPADPPTDPEEGTPTP